MMFFRNHSSLPAKKTFSTSTSKLWIATFVALLSSGGCAGFIPQPGPGPLVAGNYVTLTTPFVAVGDTQEHESTGFPLHDNDSAVDAYAEFAQRPPEQSLFGRRILEWALENHPNEPFIHLGDVMDLSCRAEAERMAKIFQADQSPGAILPGNHDGLMFGIYAYSLIDAQLDPGAQKWNRVCRRGAAPHDQQRKTDSEAFTKRDFIANYISHQANGRPPKPGLEAPPGSGEHGLSWRHPGEEEFLTGIEAKLLDGFAYADSYIAQRIKLPRAPGATRDVFVIALDTNQAGFLVSTWDVLMGRSPGDFGHVHPDQIRAVTKWVLDAARNGDIVVFAGHHNWRSLGLPTRFLLRNLMSNLPHPLVYLSAHTHRGFWAEHRAFDNRPLLELNVSSLSDWPIAYRRISFAYDENANRLLVRGELMPRGAAPSSSDADLLAAWEAQTCGRSGLSLEHLLQEDSELVKHQRAARGTVLEWLIEGLSPVCESCEQTLYDHAHAYQDLMMEALLQVSYDLGPLAAQLNEMQLPAWCDDEYFKGCVLSLLSQRPDGLRADMNLFRRKAELVDLINQQLDDLKAPKAKDYMTCRAVLAAKIDFDATDDNRKDNRGEAYRRAEQFFRIEATVGMD